MEQQEESSGDSQTTLMLSQEEAFFGTIRILTLPAGPSIDIYVPPGAYNGQRIYPETYPAQVSRDTDQLFFITLAITPPDQNKQQNIDNRFELPVLNQQHIPAVQPQEYTLTGEPYSPIIDQHSIKSVSEKIGQRVKFRRRNIFSRTVLLLFGLFMLTSATIAYIAGRDTYLQPLQQSNNKNAQDSSFSSLKQTQIALETAKTDAVQAQKEYDAIRRHAPALNDHLQTTDVYHWETGTGCAYIHGTYEASETQKNLIMSCTALNTRYHNFIYQVQMRIMQGDAGGIIFRATTDRARFYLFQIGQDGSYDVYYYSEQTGEKAQHLLSGVSNFIHIGTQRANLVGVLTYNNRLKFYINERYLTSVVQNELTTGQVGVIAASATNATVVSYTQAEVWDIIAKPTMDIQR